MTANSESATPATSDESAIAEQPTRLATRRTLWILSALVLFWAVEILILQQLTTFPEAAIPTGRVVKDAARRLLLNVAACTVIVCLLRGWALRASFVIGLIATNLLFVYASYFGSPLSWPVLSSQWREGLAVSDHGMSLINWNVFAIGLLALAIKIGLANAVRRGPLPRRTNLKWASIAATTYVALAVSLAVVHKPIRRIHMGTPEYIYGYVVAWTAEAISFDNETLLKEALAKAEAKSDVLTNIEQPLNLADKVAIIQVESLDFDAIESTVDGEPVMPFLQDLQQLSMRYSVKPFHNTGSSEADFSMLTTATPNGRVNPFQIYGFPYDQALPWLAKQQGYAPFAFHGNTGEFFHRRKAYDQMGFEKLYFTEELKPLEVAGEWDEELLDFSAELLAKASEPTLHFVITITSHGPFNKLKESERELYTKPSSPHEHYLNSMRYVDHALESYIDQLPEDTTVVIYGDHQSNIHGYGESETHRDHVPWLIYQKGNDLSKQQNSLASGLALSGNLSQLDMVCYLRDRLAETPLSDDRIAAMKSNPRTTLK
ncbi:phosphoglycerol transferase MdoB-like AlkP superfamily enzyme [Rhodopirellula rubra]|uniref:Phosphoglycerol transferase MdoB-like AlkP superfamily enzyme n=1 Tax=Aporhodopirellula rubra TaxID=980271 RepID=A0A7W5E0E1_9BACT|nr:LTA synthase family protein [Aporhodopirellula rubra]MBB3207810.1 phosphoglycerol transferase MdoB-like AlkP superfamily enzyme [Aporhodopirellula rubra]